MSTAAPHHSAVIVATDVQINWEGMGRAFADAASDEQAFFLAGMVQEFEKSRREGGSPENALTFIGHTVAQEQGYLAPRIADYLEALARRVRSNMAVAR